VRPVQCRLIKERYLLDSFDFDPWTEKFRKSPSTCFNGILIPMRWPHFGENRLLESSQSHASYMRDKKNRLCRRRPNDNFASTGPIAPKFTERCCPYDARLPNSVRIGWALPNLFAKDCRFRNPKSITIEADRCVLFRLQWHGAARSIYATAELLVSQACIVIVVIHRYDNISHKL